MTTTISKHDLQQHQQQQQQQPHQKQRSSLASTIINSITYATTRTCATTTFAKTDTGVIAASATGIMDSPTTVILIDSLNNNNTNTAVTAAATTTTTAGAAPTTPGVISINFDNSKKADMTTAPITGENNNGHIAESFEGIKTQKRRSLLSFKSFDFNIKSLYSGLRNGASRNSQAQSAAILTGSGSGNGNGSSAQTPTGYGSDSRGAGSCGGAGGGGGGGRRSSVVTCRVPPYLKIEAVDAEESENLLLDYPQSPYSSRRNSSPNDENRSSSQLLHINRYDVSRSQASSPSPYFLSPYVSASGNIRRSSTSDIMSCKRSGTSSTSDSRRPSTSDLLRRARERRGSEARMGQRSVSHGGLARGGFRSGCGGGMGGRRTSMAF